MRKRFRRRMALIASLLLLFQLFFSSAGAYAASESNTMLPPSNLSYQLVTPDDIKLTWSAVYGATGYNIYEITDGQLLLRGTTASSSYTLNDRAEGSYTFVVSTLNGQEESGPCAPITIDVAYPEMAAPQTLSYSIQNGNDIALSWGASQYAENYNIYKIGTDGQKELVTTTASRTFTVKNVEEGTSSYAVASANHLYGESQLSSPAQVQVVYPDMQKPANLTFSIANGNDIILRWSASAYAAGYKVYQVEGGQKTLLSSVTGTTATFANKEAGDYTFEVHSYSDRFGESAEGSQVLAAVSEIIMAAPANLAKTIKNGNDLTLSWSPVQYANGYRVYLVTDSGNVLKSTVTTGTSITYANMPAGEYVYEVNSYSDRFGESADGSKLSVAIDQITMAAPANFSYTIKNGNDIALAWDAVPYADSYKIYLVKDGQKTLKSTSASTTLTYSNLAEGNYTYEVHSYSSKFGESAEGSMVEASVVYPVMAAPSNLIQTIKSASSFTLTWDPAAYATSYKVYQIVNGQKVLKSTVSGTSVTYSGMVPGDYTYVVHSYSSRFGESAEGSKRVFTLNGLVMLPPANPTYTVANGNDITLKWTAAANANQYKIYQSVDGEWVYKTTVTSTSAIFSNLPEGDYTFGVSSVSTLYGESAEYVQISLQLDWPEMTAPANLSYKIQNGNDVVLSWAAVPYATAYRIYELADGQETLTASVTSLSATLPNVSAGDHSYVVRSFSSRFGESASGSQASLNMVLPVMQAPASPSYTITNGNDITLRWTASPFATNYKVYQIIDGIKVLKSTATSTSAVFANMPEGDYSFEIHSFSSRYGESSEGSIVSFQLVHPVMQAPANFKYSISNGNDIVLSWSASTYATGYRVYLVSGGEKSLIKDQAGTSLVYTNMPEGPYSYEVHSYSSRFGESPEGSSLAFDLVHPVMQAPLNLTSSIVNGNDIVLRWASASFATNYKVYMVSDGVKTLKNTVNGTSLTLPNMPEGDYQFEIHSYSSRFGESVEGTTLNYKLVWPVVNPPVLSGSVFNANNMTLSWPSVTWANEYRLYEVTDGGLQLVYKGTGLTAKVYNLTEEIHSFAVFAYSTRFGESEISNTVTETIVYPIMEKPAASLKLLDNTTAQISWGFVTYANNYNIYEIIDGRPVLLAGNVNNLSYKVTNLSYANHEYYVTSFSNSFGESEPSNTVLAKLIIDTEAPVTASDAPADWTNREAVTVHLSATDNETGVSKTFYSINGSDFIEGTAFTITQAGITKASYYSVDKVGNIEAGKTVYIKLDQTAPVTTANIPSGWNNMNVDVVLKAEDHESGVSKTFFSIDGGAYQEGTSFTIGQEGIHQVHYYSVDAAGNAEAVKTEEIKVDATAPITTSNIPSGWNNMNVDVVLKAEDHESGVSKTLFSIDGGAYQEGTSFTIGQEGIHQVRYYSVDAAGNAEAVKTEEIKVDATAPVTTADMPEGWVNTDVAVTLNAGDNLSGVSKTFYSIDGAEVKEGTAFTITEEGVHSITYYSVDASGNKEEVQTAEVKVDKTAPATSSDAPSSWATGDVTVNLFASDGGSGVSETFYSIDGGDYQQGSSFTISDDGIYIVRFYSADKAGNKENEQSVLVKIDKTAAETVSDAPADWNSNNVTITLKPDDSLSGVAGTFYSVDGAQFEEGTVVTLSDEGIHQLSFYSVDQAGNIEAKKTSVIKIDKTAPEIYMNPDAEYKLGTSMALGYIAFDTLSGIASEEMTVIKPGQEDGTPVENGEAFSFDQPGVYTVTVTATNAAGLKTSISRQFTVYIPVAVEVTPKVINNSKGAFTVRVSLPEGFSTKGFDLDSATLNGVPALTSNNGYYNQAKLGQFKFERSDFSWKPSEVTVKFRGYADGQLVVGETTVKVNK